MVIHKGEQFTMPFSITNSTGVVTSENVDGVRIKIANKLCEWPDGELEYDSENECWLFPLKECWSFGLNSGMEKVEVAIKIGEEIIKTDTFKINVRDSIITEKWSNGTD